MADDFSDLGAVPTGAKAGVADFTDLGAASTPKAEPDMSGIQSVFNSNLKQAKENKPQTTPDPTANTDVHPAQNFLDDWMAGWQMSTTALGLTRQKLPDTVLPEDAGRFAKIVSQAGTIAGDLPAMLVGGVAGGIAGEAIAGKPGAKVGASAGAFALPAGIREALVQHYQKGDIVDWNDFYDRSSAVLLKSVKAGLVGAATGAAGIGAGALMPAAASPLLKLGAVTAAEGSVMTTVGAALDGRVPNKDDFVDTALLLTAMHGVGKVAPAIGSKISENIQNKLMDIYGKTGMSPHDVYETAVNDPVLRQQLVSDDQTVPQQLIKAIDPKSTPDIHSVELAPEGELSSVNKNMSPATQSESANPLKVQPLTDAKNPSIPEEPPSVESSQKAVLDRIGVQPDAPKTALNWDKFYYQYVDKNDPIKLATEALNEGKALGAKDDPYALVRSIGANSKRADAAIEAGPADFNTLKPTGTPGLKEILDPFKNDLDGFRAFMISKRAIELEGQQKPTGVPIEDAIQVVKAGEKKYGKAFNNFVQYQNDILKYADDAGLFKPGVYDKMLEMNKNYVSFKRVMGADEESGGKGTGKGLNVFNPVQQLKGSNRSIIDPIESAIRNTHAIIAVAEKNRALLKLTDLMDKAENPDLGVKVPTPLKPIEVTSQETSQFLKQNGLDPEDAAAFTVFRGKGAGLEDNQIASFKDGKKQVYEVPKELAASVRHLDDSDVGNVVKILSVPAKGLRTGMIASPDFMARHFIRQEFMSTIFAKDTYVPIATTLQGLAGIIGKTEPYYEWLRAGGANDSIASINENYLKNHIYDLNDQTGFADKAWNMIKAPIEGLKLVTQLTDEARTFGKYLAAKRAGKDPFQAGFDARDSAIDASRVGANLRAWNMIVPFENMRVQGLDLIGRNFKENPVNTLTKLLTTVTLPSVYLWYANHEDERYKDLNDRDRDMNWHFFTKDNIYRVPKPFEPGVVFGSLVERSLDKYFTDNPGAYKGFQQAMVESVMPQYVPAFAAPILEQFANKSLYNGAPLIPSHLEKMLPEYQSSPYTSDMAKLMGGILRQVPLDATRTPGSLGSPIVLDNYVRAWGGNLGQYAIQAADTILEKSGAAKAAGIQYVENRPENTLADIPFIKAFVTRYPSSNVKSIGEFYDRFQVTETRLNTIHQLAKNGDFADMEKEYKTAQSQNQLINLAGYKTAISNQMQLIQRIYADPNTNPHEKRQQIDQFYTLIINEAHLANQTLDEMDKQLAEVDKSH